MVKNNVEQRISLYDLTSSQENGVVDIVYKNSDGIDFKIPIPLDAHELIVSVNYLPKKCHLEYSFRGDFQLPVSYFSALLNNNSEKIVVDSFFAYCDCNFKKID